ncbi:hypothetical protein AAMO2058_000673400 [Amorphochlora amoebiformis]
MSLRKGSSSVSIIDIYMMVFNIVSSQESKASSIRMFQRGKRLSGQLGLFALSRDEFYKIFDEKQMRRLFPKRQAISGASSNMMKKQVTISKPSNAVTTKTMDDKKMIRHALETDNLMKTILGDDQIDEGDKVIVNGEERQRGKEHRGERGRREETQSRGRGRKRREIERGCEIGRGRNRGIRERLIAQLQGDNFYIVISGRFGVYKSRYYI